ncbi:Fe(3+) dicitrate ABC transporter ATP-binding protein FecE [Klebsiella spallanzanii]|uniref:Fe(3+) dicitrate ABC transporter ATP-binding protein FecE n=1 Tax=Klebsiella spallanzanii TaxID=2587528 RepID=UPI00115AC069|nr:Fe(3+) dicitrate ABC transporter ATP-binding protein FecE [Klebsiella spallanzanii]VUT05570.1 Fe(3+) dicitrate transport ATP-binding protein FecE [Klebsiella spallanzanii]
MELRTENLTAGYDGKRIINDLNLTLPGGKITALLGPNGCGKSTLLKCFSRLLTPDAGEIWLGNQILNGISTRQLARRLALLPQQHHVPEGVTVRELVGYGRSPWLPMWGRLSAQDRARVERALERTGVAALAEQPLSALSGGQRQRAFLALLLAQDTPLVLLDEPTTWLDINHQVELMRLMRELQLMGKTVVTVLHDLNQASRYSDHLVVLAGGQVQAQGPAETVLTPEMLREVFSLEAEIHPEPISQRPMCVVK